MKKILKGQKGFIFIDAIVGMVILTVALTALAVAYRQATITTVAAREYNNAVFLAQQTAEGLKMNDGRQAADAIWDVTTPVTIDNVEYKVRATMDNVNYLQQATIVVSWPKNTTGISIVSYYYLSP